MESLYFLNRQHFTAGDVRIAWKFAKELMKKDENIDTLTFLVYSANQYAPFLTNELGISERFCKQHVVPNQFGKRIQIHTVKTYQPNYKIQGREECELLLVIGVPPKDLEPFVDKFRVKYWIIVPWLMEENENFIKLHEGIDIETWQKTIANYELDPRVAHAIEWLKATSNPNEGFTHLLDLERLKQMANALRHYCVKLSYDGVMHYCINHGIWDNSGAKMIADYFTQAQTKRYKVERDDLDFMKSMMEREDW